MILIYIGLGILFLMQFYTFAVLTIVTVYIANNEAIWKMQGDVNIDTGRAIKAVSTNVLTNNKWLLKLVKKGK